jgi:hypothetical protein
MTGREHDVSGLTAAELERARRELSASLALARPGSPIAVPIESHLDAIDAELDARAASRIYQCGCGFCTDDPAWFAGHLFAHPGHDARPQSPKLPAAERDG